MTTSHVPATNGTARTIGEALSSATTGGSYSIQPQNFGELQAFCTMIANSDLAPKDYRGKPGNVLVAVQMGSEIGLQPMQSIQNIAVINGRPSVWGDAALALIKRHPSFVSCREWIEGEGDNRVAHCEMVRRGEPPYRATFGVAKAKQAGLWNKEGPWRSYPERMMQMRARGFCGRDAFPDALKGLSFAEEAMDIPADGAQEYSAPEYSTGATRTDSVRDKMRAQVTSVTPIQSETEQPAQEASGTSDGTLFGSAERAKPSQLEALFAQAKRKGMKAEQFAEILDSFGGHENILVTQLAGIQQAVDDAIEGGSK